MKVLRRGTHGLVGEYTCEDCKSLLEVVKSDLFIEAMIDGIMHDGPFVICQVCYAFVDIRIPDESSIHEDQLPTHEEWLEKNKAWPEGKA